MENKTVKIKKIDRENVIRDKTIKAERSSTKYKFTKCRLAQLVEYYTNKML
jgi:hypothetical protein